MPRAAAFFDLDKTLIEGSSAIDFARASFKRGLLSRRQMAKDLLANVRFRLQGSTDVGTEQLRNRVLDAIAGMRQRDLARIGPDVLATLLPRLYPQMLHEAGVLAAGFLERVGKDGEPDGVESAVTPAAVDVGLPGELAGEAVLPGEQRAAEGLVRHRKRAD